MGHDRARIELAECGDSKGEVRTGSQHGVHDVPDFELVLGVVHDVLLVCRDCWECFDSLGVEIPL